MTVFQLDQLMQAVSECNAMRLTTRMLLSICTEQGLEFLDRTENQLLVYLQYESQRGHHLGNGTI